MALKEALLGELDHEMSLTRTTLERVPQDKLSWKPHPKSMTMGELASHLAEIPKWAIDTLQSDSLDLNPPGGSGYKLKTLSTVQEILATMDSNVKTARTTLSSTGEDKMFQPWSLLSGGKTIFTLPRVGVFRTFIFSHMIHHRAQLGVYLRMNDVSVPSIYGPSADEGQM